jgi:3-deoxy-manno-octulosonate cytidylyltransferase (CMP-KDO synthetase)
MNIWCVIPARYGSTRFPGKPLALIGDKPMIQWVYEKAVQAKSIDRVLVATDDRRILQTVQSFGGQAVMTPSELPSGTDRVAFAVKNEAVDVVINLQGDEPFVQPELLDALAHVFVHRNDVHLATPVKRITRYEELVDPNLVRVVIDKEGWALYFTRSVIPYLRDVAEQSEWPEHFPFFKHVGIYAYRKPFLLEFTTWPPARLEQAERLEQLRVLENGRKIFTVQTEYESLSVDTPQDLEKLNQRLNQKK